MVTNSFTTNDGASICFEDTPCTEDTFKGHPLVLIHGWSGSSRVFNNNVGALSHKTRIIQYDLRGHGESSTTPNGARVSRLAKDLQELLDHLNVPRAILLGCSLGCAIIWNFVELFGCSRIAAAIFVDQSPWQMYAADGSWRLGANGLFSASALANFVASLTHDPAAFHAGTVRACLTREPTEYDMSFFRGEALKASAPFLAKLMTDHNNNDWRDVLPLVTCPALVFVGRDSKVFPWQGVAYAAGNMPNSEAIIFDKGSHWLYYEEPERFNEEVIAFLDRNKVC